MFAPDAGDARPVLNLAQQLQAHGLGEILIALGRHHEAVRAGLDVAPVIVGEV
jgi:hypothetical protein